MEVPTLNQLSELISPNTAEFINKKDIQLSKFRAGSLFLVSDITVICLTFLMSFLLRNLLWSVQSNNLIGLPFLGLIVILIPLSFFFAKLYPGYGIDVVDEIRTITISTTIVFGALATASFLTKEMWEYSRFIYLMSWVASLPLLPLGRSLIRNIFSKKSWWGIPVMIVGAGRAGDDVTKSLLKHKNVGLKPVVAVDDNSDRWGYLNGIPVVGGIEIVSVLKEKLNIENVIIAMPSATRQQLNKVVNKVSEKFESFTIIPELYNSSSIWVSSKTLHGIQGLELKHNLLTTRAKVIKRISDIILTSLLMILVSPIFLIVPFLIKLESKGKVYFHSNRIGINKSRFKMFKFRTMHKDAEKRLKEVMKENEDLRIEYNLYHKLKDDPRITKIGKFLRKFSIDELPNFINVLKGEMSLIGPRSYLFMEFDKMSEKERDIVFQVKPGVTGLWQVTEGMSYFESRVQTDIYYLSNWSLFLDVYIFVRTIAVVFMGKNN